VASMAHGNEERQEYPWLDRASFDGSSDEQAEQLVLEHLAAAPVMESEDLPGCHAHLRHGDSTQQGQALYHLRTYLLGLALGISRTYPPVALSLPSAVAAIDTAIEKWEPTSGYSLGTFGSWFIRQAITRDQLSRQDLTLMRPIDTESRQF
jgi:DNA-directed RNA polymerase sigma subunit (sigma70/sigma32)